MIQPEPDAEISNKHGEPQLNKVLIYLSLIRDKTEIRCKIRYNAAQNIRRSAAINR